MVGHDFIHAIIWACTANTQMSDENNTSYQNNIGMFMKPNKHTMPPNFRHWMIWMMQQW
jgi:hypothetical protein